MKRTPFSFSLAQLLAALATSMPLPAQQTNSTNAPSTNTITAAQDHHQMMELLGITSIRPGRDGSRPQSTNYAHYDEAIANLFPKLPDPLVLKNGKSVTTP